MVGGWVRELGRALKNKHNQCHIVAVDIIKRGTGRERIREGSEFKSLQMKFPFPCLPPPTARPNVLFCGILAENRVTRDINPLIITYDLLS